MVSADVGAVPPGSVSDADLCRAAAEGDGDALSTLLRRYAPLVSERARRIVCHGLDSDDLYQEGMIALIRAALTYDSTKNASFKTYATTCLLNRFRDLLRKDGGNRLTESLDETASAPASDPEEQIMLRDELERLRAVMDTALSARERTIITDYLSGLSYEQIAEKNGCDVKSVNNALCRVRRKLKS